MRWAVSATRCWAVRRPEVTAAAVEAVGVLQAQCARRGGVEPERLTDLVTERIQCSGHPTLHSRDDARAQFSRRNDRVDRTHLAGPLDVVYSFKFRCHLAELVRTYCRLGGGAL